MRGTLRYHAIDTFALYPYMKQRSQNILTIALGVVVVLLIGVIFFQDHRERIRSAPTTSTSTAQTTEIAFGCATEDKRLSLAPLNSLLKKAKWETAGDSYVTICLPTSSTSSMALIATSNCTFSKATPNPPCDTAALILADTKAKALRVLATEETSANHGDV